MKALLITLCAFSLSVRLQAGTFQNLNFEDANLSNVITTQTNPLLQEGTINELVPGWTVLGRNNVSFTTIGYNSFALSPGYSTLVSQNGGNEFFNVSGFPIEGNFALFLSPRFPFTGETYQPQRLVQIGTIPTDARGIQFLNFGNPFALEINGHAIPLTYDYHPNPISNSPELRNATVTGDISAYTGQEVELKFSTTVLNAYVNGIDDITFTAVPEPGTLALSGVAILLLGLRTALQKLIRTKL